jgi:hypothetical protein
MAAATASAIRRLVLARLAEQRSLTRSLLRLREQLAGSLFVRFGQCGKPGCVCLRGARHGPYYVLSTREGGQGGFAYLAREEAARARTLIGHHRRFRAGLRRLRAVNAIVVRLLRAYQKKMAAGGRARVALVARRSLKIQS